MKDKTISKNNEPTPQPLATSTSAEIMILADRIMRADALRAYWAVRDIEIADKISDEIDNMCIQLQRITGIMHTPSTVEAMF